eukprot:364669-Chlamydomonas_euryale.AAC.8
MHKSSSRAIAGGLPAPRVTGHAPSRCTVSRRHRRRGRRNGDAHACLLTAGAAGPQPCCTCRRMRCVSHSAAFRHCPVPGKGRAMHVCGDPTCILCRGAHAA